MVTLNSKLKNIDLNTGDKVWLKLPKEQRRQMSLHFDKLSSRWLGPYVILDKLSNVTFSLLLPTSMNIHNVFHVSLLKPYFAYLKTDGSSTDNSEISDYENLENPEILDKPSKCFFGVHEVEFCGFLVNKDGIFMGHNKCLLIDKWPAPSNFKEVRSF